MLRYPCLVLDHDDTVVQSETTINYPFFCYILDQFRPGATITLEEYVSGLETYVSKVVDSELITVLTRMFKAQL